MPLLNPQSYSKTYKIDEIDSITFKGIQGITSHPRENVWMNPIILIHTKEEKENMIGIRTCAYSYKKMRSKNVIF